MHLMKKLHIINTKALTDIQPKLRGKVLPLLEKETLDWASKNQPAAHSATLAIKQELAKNPGSVTAKYFKYLRRLLELQLEELDKQEIPKEDKTKSRLNKDLLDLLSIEALNIPDYLSCTQISLMDHCPRKYWYSYILGISFPKTASLHMGTSIDEALNLHYTERVKGITPPISAINAQFYETFEKGRADVRWGKDDPEILLKSGPAIIAAYLKAFDKITKPTGVQTEVIVPFENGGYLKGFIDILEEDAIVDTKTAAKFWKTDKNPLYDKARQELQPKAYSLWYYEEMGRLCPEFRYQIVTKETDKKGNAIPRTQLIKLEVKKFELESFKLRIQKMWNQIQEALPKGKEGFPAQADPASHNPDVPGFGIGKKEISPLCCKEWCDYADLCKKDGLRVPLKWVSKTKDVPGHHIYDEDLSEKDN